MSALLSTTLALIWLLVGLAAAALMWELQGRSRIRPGDGRLRTAHRVLGGAFTVLLAVAVAFMVRKAAGYQEELSPRALTHVGLAVAVTVLLAAKLWVVRRSPALSPYLFPLGTTILALAAVLVALTGGHFLLHREDVRYVTLGDGGGLALDPELGRALLFKKCNKCHSFERILLAYKTEQGWLETLNRMAAYDAPHITGFDVRQIAHFLLRNQEARQGEDPARVESEVGRALVASRCSRCHTLERVYQAEKSAEEWTGTVERMIDHAKDPRFLSEEDKREVVRFLSGQTAPGGPE